MDVDPAAIDVAGLFTHIAIKCVMTGGTNSVAQGVLVASSSGRGNPPLSGESMTDNGAFQALTSASKIPLPDGTKRVRTRGTSQRRPIPAGT
jgi:hypothetical protein